MNLNVFTTIGWRDKTFTATVIKKTEQFSSFYLTN
ncbi:Uncharacterised protein [Edwardsiella ictaluri]|nr:Uncharacterised protein [Edwardsiella ictaluri]